MMLLDIDTIFVTQENLSQTVTMTSCARDSMSGKSGAHQPPPNSSHSASLPNMTISGSPVNRQHLVRISRRHVDGLEVSYSTGINKIPRDSSQPRTGSFSDLHSEHSVDDELGDLFPTAMPFRPRAQTCPDNRAWLRKMKVRARSRPPTPPPGGFIDNQLVNELNKISIRDQRKLNVNKKPSSIPENHTETTYLD
jgi:hypothetical protein